MKPDRERVTEAGLIMASFAARLPADQQRQLARLLGHSLAAPSRAAIRESVLGLLAELVRHGEKPTVQQYEEARRERLAQGQEWPAASTLVRRYGRDRAEQPRAGDRYGDGWHKACVAAGRLVAIGSTARVPASYRHAGHGTRYTREDVARALTQVRSELGDWPNQWEYEEHARVRRHDRPDDRLPGLKQIETLFGSFGRAVELAQRASAPHPRESR